MKQASSGGSPPHDLESPNVPSLKISNLGRSDASAAATPSMDEFSLVARERRVQEILANIETLPSLPSVVMRIMELASNANTQASDFEEIIQKDPSLAAKVLRLVNSPFFGMKNKISSISQAIVVLGFKSLKGIVIAAKTSKLLDRQLHQYGMDAGGLWKHSISTATTCHVLARKKSLSPDAQEEVFVGGLLHDIGKIVLAPYVAKYQSDFDRGLAERGGDVIKTETELLGISHADVSGRMAGKWGLAPELGSLMRDHHAKDGFEEVPLELGILRLANDLCNQMGIGLTGGPREASPDYVLWLGALGLGCDQGELEADVRVLLGDLQGTFRNMVAE